MSRKLILIFTVFIFISFKQISAQTWEKTKRLTWNTGFSELPVLAVDSSDHVHVVWEDFSPGNTEIFYKKSTDGGTSWSTSKRLTWNSGFSHVPCITIDASDRIHIAWGDDSPGNMEIYHRVSTDGGSTWTSSKRLTWNSGMSRGPVLAAGSSDVIHLVWEDGTPANTEIYYRKSSDGGMTWLASKRLTWNSDWSQLPCAATDSSNNIHVVWFDGYLDDLEIYYKKSTDGGASWSSSMALTQNPGWSSFPRIAIDSSDNIHVTWEDEATGSSDIYYRRSTDGGMSWSGIKRLTWNSGSSYVPAIVVDQNDVVHVIWSDETPGNFETYWKKSTNGGLNWSGSMRLTWNSGDSISPAIACDSADNLHTCWHDYSAGNIEIFYKKGKQ